MFFEKIFGKRCGAFSAACFLVWASGASAQNYVTRSLRIPMRAAGPAGLEALLVLPVGKGPFPLALLNHGSPRDGAERRKMTPQQMQPELMEFARRGWAAAVVMRRGYGTSGGAWAESYGTCAAPDYVSAGRAAAADLKAAIAALSSRPDIDRKRILAVGVSAGGFAVTALTADPPPGLVAAISFAGGRGSLSADHLCRSGALIEAFRVFGSRSKVPMLWVYAENDHFFGPQIAMRLDHVFVAGGGKVDFKQIAAFGADGHSLFSAAGRSVWAPLVDEFLRRQGLEMTRHIAPLPVVAKLRPPGSLNARGRQAFQTYLAAAPHKAFAIGARGAYAWRTARRNTSDARAEAMAFCTKIGGIACRLYALDDAYYADPARR